MFRGVFDAASVSLLLLSVPRLMGMALLGDRDPKGWYFGILSAVGSIAWAMWTNAYALVAVSTLTLFVSLRGAKRWAHSEDSYGVRYHRAVSRIAALELELEILKSEAAR